MAVDIISMIESENWKTTKILLKVELPERERKELFNTLVGRKEER